MEKTKASLFATLEAFVAHGVLGTSLALPGASAHPSTTPAAIQISSTKQKLVMLVEKSEGLNDFLEFQWIHFIDSGG